ncbi:MAG: acyltransferase [Clostridiales bacterium]|nr:acyltransferase [Clostridiales bacterium]
MKIFLLFTIIVFAAYLFGFVKRVECNDWMGRNFTTAIKGFAIFTVVWAHTGAHFGVGCIQFVAGTGVALFLICSGYGLECSYQMNGLKQFISKRLLRVCIPFWIVEFFGLLATGELTLQEYFKNALFIDCTWYLQFIMVCYILFFCIKISCEKLNLQKKHEWMLWGFCTIVWFIIESCFLADASMPFLRARQMLSFPLGIAIAQNKDAILEFMKRKKKTLLIGAGETVRQPPHRGVD